MVGRGNPKLGNRIVNGQCLTGSCGLPASVVFTTLKCAAQSASNDEFDAVSAFAFVAVELSNRIQPVDIQKAPLQEPF